MQLIELLPDVVSNARTRFARVAVELHERLFGDSYGVLLHGFRHVVGSNDDI